MHVTQILDQNETLTYTFHQILRGWSRQECWHGQGRLHIWKKQGMHTEFSSNGQKTAET